MAASRVILPLSLSPPFSLPPYEVSYCPSQLECSHGGLPLLRVLLVLLLLLSLLVVAGCHG
jgi:hypothetical protein